MIYLAKPTSIFRFRNGATTAGHSNRVFAVKWHPVDANIALSGGWDNTIQASSASDLDSQSHVCKFVWSRITVVDTIKYRYPRPKKFANINFNLSGRSQLAKWNVKVFLLI